MSGDDAHEAGSPPALTRSSSYASQGDGLGEESGTSSRAGGRLGSFSSSSIDGMDADLLGVPTDMDGNPIVATADEMQPTSTLTDLVNTFWSTTPRLDLDLLDRKLRQASERMRQRVKAADTRDRDLTSHTPRHAATLAREIAAEQKAELKRLKAKVARRVDKMQARWAEQKNVRLRDKLSFVVGVMNLVISSLVFAYAPHKVHVLYTIQCAWFLPIRIYSYYRLHWHYFLFDYCYFANILNLLYIWAFPANIFLFSASYCAAHGPLAFSIATWRNSAVFHDLGKMCSLFIHLYPPITFTAMRHFMDVKRRDERFPAITALPLLDGWTAFAWNVTFYLVWQLCYYLFISRRKASKIASGERINSFSHMSKGKGAVAKVLAKAPIESREWAFIALQFAYTILCTLPAPLLLYNSSRASAIFCLLLILLSVWNGASYYVEVWGRRFERELEALRREVEATNRQSKSIVANEEGEEVDDAAKVDDSLRESVGNSEAKKRN